MPIACDKCRENLALLVEPKNSAGSAGAFARAAEAVTQDTAPLLNGAERAELEAHVASCPECARELALLRAMIGELQTLPIAAAPASLQNRIRAEIANETAAKSQTGNQPSWLTGWRNFFRSPSRMAWASGMAMAAFAMIMLRDQPLSTVQTITDSGPVTTRPQSPQIASRPNTSAGGEASKPTVKANSKAVAKAPAAPSLPGQSPIPRQPAANHEAVVSGQRNAASAPAPAAKTGDAGGRAAIEISPSKRSTGVAESRPALSRAPQPSPAFMPPAAKSMSGHEHAAKMRVLPGNTEDSSPSTLSAPVFSPPATGGLAAPHAAPVEKGPAPVAAESEPNRRFTLRGGGEAASDGAAPVKPKIQSRGIFAGPNGDIVSGNGYAPGASSQDATASQPPSTMDSTASTQMYAGAPSDTGAARSTRRNDGVNLAGRPAAALKSPAPGPSAKTITVNGKGMSSSEIEAITGSQRMRKADLPASLNALPVKRTAEVEVSLSASQDAPDAEARVTLPPGLRFESGPVNRTQIVWRGAAQQKKPVRVNFKVTGVQTGLWPVDITLQKPDGTKLDTLTVKVTVVP